MLIFFNISINSRDRFLIMNPSNFIQATPEKEIIEQEQSFKTLLQGLGKASESQIKSVLAEREVAQPEAELTPEIITSLQQKISNATRV